MSHGLAATIRGTTDSETFDLAGQNVSTVASTIQEAFQDPLPLESMIRITFVTGAGKLGRQKYDEGCAKAVTSTLRDLGYEEDRGASCVNECAGSFKLQHDTGKNLKTVVVFPKLSGTKPPTDEMGAMTLEPTADSLFPQSSPEHMIAMSSKNVFERMVKSKCPSWTQKKGCVAAIAILKATAEDLDAKLLSGTPLTDAEQTFYDSVSLSSLEEKQNLVRDLMHEQVDSGNITSGETSTLLAQVGERLETLSKDLEKAKGKPKLIEKLQKMQEKARARQDKIKQIDPKPPHPLKNETEINKLRREMQPLIEVEQAAKGRLLSIKETQAVARKEEIEAEIAELEQSSRGWFEDDEGFEARVAACRQKWTTSKKRQKKKPAAKVGGSTSIGKTSQWVTPTFSKKTQPYSSKPAAAKKPKGGGVFAAMMMDSDSD